MAHKSDFNTFGKNKSWQDKVIEADDLWQQVKSILDSKGLTLPQTPRRPDVRLIVDNATGAELRFHNPGDHSGSKEEVIPASGDSTAVMIMVKGATLAEQYANAKTITDKYDLAEKGFSADFLQDLKGGKLSALVDEAYGPAPFAGQASKLVELDWSASDGSATHISPVVGQRAAFGARAATMETVFLAQFHIYVKGSGTTPELVESNGMNIAVTSDWQSGKTSTRPIVPSVAKTYYGANVTQIPTAIVHPDGIVKGVDLGDGNLLANKPATKNTAAKTGLKK